MNTNNFVKKEDVMEGYEPSVATLRAIMKNSFSRPGLNKMFEGFSLDVDPSDFEDED